MTRDEHRNGHETEQDTGLLLKRPPMYRVYLLNDDYTTMDFVVQVLETVFSMQSVEATRTMLHVHKNGKGLAGTYTREIAETKADNVQRLAREQGFPLRCSMEKE